MAQTIESFVEKLHNDGVAAGQKAADELKQQAEQQAQDIIAKAQAQAEQIVAEANAKAEQIAQRERSELDLAIRDKMLAFREQVSAAVMAVIQYEVGQSLSDAEFLPQLIHDAVVNYASEDARSSEQVVIKVNADSLKAVTDWALKYIAQNDPKRAHVDIKGTLKGIGFEYKISESTVEVTQESIVGALREQISPQLREVLDRILG